MRNEIGVLVSLKRERSPLDAVEAFGLRTCEIMGGGEENWTDENADRLREEAARRGIRISVLGAGWPGPCVWDFVDGPNTLGIVPRAYRMRRLETLLAAAPFAKRLGAPAVRTHIGFVPEDPSTEIFREVVAAMRYLMREYEKLDLEFWLETGQETPVTLVRLIQAVGSEKIGVNLDPANLVMYGKANPIDAIGLLGPHLRNIHAKDGMYPTDPIRLGAEVPLGTGRVRYPEFLRALAGIGFEGDLIIEREISGERQRRDIATGVEYLRKLLAEI